MEEFIINTSKKTLINDQIRAPEVLLIGAKGEQVGVVSLAAALQHARDAKLDLVEVAPQAKPPVCKLLDAGKLRYQQKKGVKKKVKQSIKEIVFRPRIAEGDYQIKMNHIATFLERGDRVRVTIKFRGREMAHQDLGLDIMKRVEKDLVAREIGQIDNPPNPEGRRITMLAMPIAKKKTAEDEG